jgi:hypothetical protein
MQFFQIQEFLKQLIILAVSNQWIIQLIVAVRVKIDLLPQLLNLFLYVLNHVRPFSFWLLQEFAAHSYIFVLILINKNKYCVFGLISHPGDNIGYTAAYFLFLLPVQFPGYPDVDVGHCLLLMA